MIRPLQEEVRSHLRSGVAITNLTQCVEELVLNSLDAGASCITVRIDIPNFKIQVSDNGSGIALGDLKSVGERYSSSKCHVLEDLEQLSFYGFRGEALASIREICDVLEIATRHRSSYHTYCKLFRNSQVLELTESRFPRTVAGTSVTVHGLFSNLPVRRKAIVETLDFDRVRHRIASIALVNPKTAFSLINDSTGTKCLQTHVCKSVVSTFSQLFGNQRSRSLQQVQFEHSNFKVSGFISTDTHHSKSLQFLFVNGRLLLKTTIHKLVNNILAKSELLKRLPVLEIKDTARSGSYQSKTTSPQNAKIFEKHGIFVLNIDCLVTEYDICLEPAKTLIEFQNWSKVLYCVERCVEEFLVKHNLISNLEDSANSDESGPNDAESGTKGLCPGNLEAFEYKREIETSNVKKSLHSSTVFRPKESKKAESPKGCGSQTNTSCLKNEYSVLSLSDRKFKSIDCKSNEGGSEFLVTSSGNVVASDSKSVSKLVMTNFVATTEDKRDSSCTKDTSFHVSHTGGTTTNSESNPSKMVQGKGNGAAASHEFTLPAHKSCDFSDLQKISTSDAGVRDIGHNSASLSDKFSKKNTTGSLHVSNAPPNTTHTRFPGLSLTLGKIQHLQRECHGSDSVCLSDYEKLMPAASRNNNQKSSVASTRSENRTKVMSTFTSPSPITLNRLCTRKRPQSNKETSVNELALTSKNRKLITLRGSFKQRFVYDRRKSMDVKSSDCDAHPVLVNDDCNTKSSTSCGDDIVTETSMNDILDTAICNSEVRSSEGSAGVTVPVEDTCDSSNSFNLTEHVSNDSTDQICLSNFRTGNKRTEELGSLETEVDSKLATQDKNVHKFVEDLNCHQEGNTEKNLLLEQDKSSHYTMISESTSDHNKNDTHEKMSESSSKDWYCTFDTSLGRKLFINSRTGHSSFEAPNKFSVEDEDCSVTSLAESISEEKDCCQHVPHPCASHLSFSCTPWLPREDRRQQLAGSTKDNGRVGSEGMNESKLAFLYKKHLEQQEAEEKLCKWTDADTLQAYEQDLFNSEGKTVAQLLDRWQNPVFAAPEKDIVMVNKQTGDKSQILVHNVVHPYRFTRDMLAGMRVLRQLDEKFIVGVVSQEGEMDDLLVLVDQHAAHERVRLERLQSELVEDGDLTQAEGKPRIKSSSVSPPLELCLFPEEVQLLKVFQAEIERIGIRFAISKTKEICKEVLVLIEGVPSVFVEREVSEVKRGRPSLAVNNVKGLIREHLEHVSSTCGVPLVIPKVISQVISSQACHGAVKFGEPLGLSECQELIQCLSKCQLPFQCAHGRPSVIPLVDLKLLGKKVTSEEIVHRPRITKLRPVLNKH